MTSQPPQPTSEQARAKATAWADRLGVPDAERARYIATLVEHFTALNLAEFEAS